MADLFCGLVQRLLRETPGHHELKGGKNKNRDALLNQEGTVPYRLVSVVAMEHAVGCEVDDEAQPKKLNVALLPVVFLQLYASRPLKGLDMPLPVFALFFN